MDTLIRINDVLNLIGVVNGDVKMDIDERIKLYANICSLPNIKAPSKGKWLKSDIGWKCSECNYGVNPWNNTNFCPNCGSDMREMKKMVRCPKCGSNTYDVEYVEETNRMYDYNYDNECVTQIVKVTCCCGHQFSVREKFIFANAENID